MREGSGLDSQEHRCRKRAAELGSSVDRIFRDSFSGGGDFLNRPAMKALLDYVDDNPHEKFVVIFDDLKRFARDVQMHMKLKFQFKTRDVALNCLNFNFEDTPEGEFIETIIAAHGELERKQNKRQVVSKMKARLENGYWCFGSPPPYKGGRVPGHTGKVPVLQKGKDAEIIKTLLKRYAAGTHTKADLARYLNNAGFRKTKQRVQSVERFLERAWFYAGYVQFVKWGVARRKGHHEAIISQEEYELIKARLLGKQIRKIYETDNPDFPLRKHLQCHSCLRYVTASWSKGRSASYPFYRCNNKDCLRGGKSMKRDEVHNLFEEHLQDLELDSGLASLVKAVILEVYREKNKDRGDYVKTLEKTLRELGAHREVLLERITRTQSQLVIETYEKELESNLLLQEKTGGELILAKQSNDFETKLDELFEMVQSPYFVWVNSGITGKKRLLNVFYPDGLYKLPENKFGTTNKPLITAIFEGFSVSYSRGVEKGGIEPPCRTGP